MKNYKSIWLLLSVIYFSFNSFYSLAQNSKLHVNIREAKGVLLYKLIVDSAFNAYKIRKNKPGKYYFKLSQYIIINDTEFSLGDAYLLTESLDSQTKKSFIDTEILRKLWAYNDSSNNPLNSKYFIDSEKTDTADEYINVGGEDFLSKNSKTSDTFIISYQISGTFAVTNLNPHCDPGKIPLQSMHNMFYDNSDAMPGITVTPLSIHGYSKLTNKQIKKLKLIRHHIAEYYFINWD